MINIKKISLLILFYIQYPGWTSQLTTPCATPYLSVDSLSPRTMSSGWEDGLAWSALSAITQHRSISWLPSDTERDCSCCSRSLSIASESDQPPLYKSYFFGLDQVGLESDEDSGDSMDSGDSDIYHVPERTKSAPLPKISDKMSSRKTLSLRHKSCFSLEVI